jgi:2-(1,2-epoxy-1,2-dihydrophenyl)acetyl-CoA isomerase
MRPTTSLVTENEFFSATREGNILVVRSKPHFSRHIGDLKKIDTFFDHLEIISRTDKVKVVVFVGTEANSGTKDTMEFFQALMEARREDYLLQRLFNMVNNYVVTLAGLNKVTIHANTGGISMFYFNLSLSCDYRIVGEGSVFENSFSMLGTIPNGGGGYYLSRLLGAGRASDVLQWPRFTAEEALNLGIVDKIVPVDKLEESALATAALYQEQQVATMLAVRRLLKSDLAELRRSLETEDMLILNRVNSPEFRTVLKPQLEAFAAGK